MPTGSKYENQRKPKDPPLVGIKWLREALGLSQEDVSSKLTEITGRKYNKGSISAVESGTRGASSELIDALEIVYELPVGAIRTLYETRAVRGVHTDAPDAAQGARKRVAS